MGSVSSSDEAHRVAEVAVRFRCPFWAPVSFGALPFALIGLVRA